jgi:hypothetical protein
MKKLDGSNGTINTNTKKYKKRFILAQKVLKKNEYAFLKNKAIPEEIFFGDNGNSLWVVGNNSIPSLLSDLKLIIDKDENIVRLISGSNQSGNIKIGDLDNDSKIIYIKNNSNTKVITEPVINVPRFVKNDVNSYFQCSVEEPSQMSELIAGSGNTIVGYFWEINKTHVSGSGNGTQIMIPVPSNITLTNNKSVISCYAYDSLGNKSEKVFKQVNYVSTPDLTLSSEFIEQSVNYQEQKIILKFGRPKYADNTIHNFVNLLDEEMKLSVRINSEGSCNSISDISYFITNIDALNFIITFTYKSNLFSSLFKETDVNKLDFTLIVESLKKNYLSIREFHKIHYF